MSLRQKGKANRVTAPAVALETKKTKRPHPILHFAKKEEREKHIEEKRVKRELRGDK